jgi:thiamine-phosphate pyrophosphorylase
VSARLYLITPPAFDPAAFAPRLAQALDGGDVACVQLRLKDVDDDTIRRAADALRPIAQEREVAFIMNDLADLALQTGCDGVHVGQDDVSYVAARQILGLGKIVGVTAYNSRHRAIEAADAGADYVAFGGFFRSTTKDTRRIAGNDPEILRWWSETMTVPCCAIGGITP